MQVTPLPEVNTNQEDVALIVLFIFQAEMLHLLRMHSLYWNDGCALCSDLVEFALCLSRRHHSLIFFSFSESISSPPFYPQHEISNLITTMGLHSSTPPYRAFQNSETMHLCGARWKQLSRNTLWFRKVLISIICRKHQRN